MKRIPIVAAHGIAHAYGYDQVVIIARKVGEDGGEHCTTYGRSKAHCAVAARIGKYLSAKVMGWDARYDRRVVVLDKIAALATELCVAVDREAEDIGGSRKSLDILRDIGPLTDELEKLRCAQTKEGYP